MPKKIEIIAEIREAILEKGADDIWKCYQCGKCSGVCPWAVVNGINFQTCKIPQMIKLGAVMESEEKDEIADEVKEMFLCIGCEACVNECPKGVGMMNIIRAIRRILVDFGSYPDTLKSLVQKINNVGNPLGEPRENRDKWADGQNVHLFSPEMEFLYFSCCIPAYDKRMQNVARATTQILQKSKTTFGILGTAENCCSEGIRRVGAEKVFQKVSKANITIFKKAGVKNILVSSPHCFTVFKNDYPTLDAKFKVLHTTQYFSQLIDAKIIKPNKSFAKKVVYHDPCTLGRQNNIYEEPRYILKNIPDLELVEVKDFNRDFSLCCGAGCGGLWLEWEKKERIGDIRIQQLVDTGAEIIAVACPYCLQMFEETIKTMDLDVQVMDVSEILWESLQ